MTVISIYYNDAKISRKKANGLHLRLTLDCGGIIRTYPKTIIFGIIGAINSFSLGFWEDF